MMKSSITILGGEILSSLGTKDERLTHLQNGTYHTVVKSMILNGDTLTFPYYAIDDKARLADPDHALPYLEKVVAVALERVGLHQKELSRCGLFLGCSSNDLSLSVPLGRNFDHSMEETQSCQRVGNGVYADFLRRTFGLGSLNFTYNTACTSSANAVMDAASMLEGGMIDYALVVGIELFAPVTFEGFASMQLLSPEAIRPFDKQRSGIVQGEAVSAVILSRSDVKASSWYYLGGMSNCETHSVTGASPDGVGIGEVITTALKSAGVKEDEITAVKAHGTASALNDTAEINGMKQAFKTLPPFFSLKPYIGHTLGGCGSAELLLMMESVDAGFVPSSANFSEMDEALDAMPLRQALPLEGGNFLLNYFGFGGNNTSFVIEKRQS
ncbi:MAG: beta-ketoacyl synthase [Epsilonproteobacteria bacterium]|nr:MAG: beta-ketoacyl synthase [Campylobacterota bacterium]